MNALEQRMAEASKSESTGPLTARLTSFQHLQNKLKALRWQFEAGTIDQHQYEAACRQMNIEFEEIATFLARYRGNVERFVSLQHTLDRRLPASAVTACRQAMTSLECWFEDFGRTKVILADPSFHIRIERLLEVAEDVVAMQTGSSARQPPPVRPTCSSWLDENSKSIRAEVLRGLTIVGDAIQTKILTQAEWSQLRADRSVIEDLLQQQRVYEAYWRTLEMRSWASNVPRNEPIDLSSLQPLDERNCFQKDALKISTFLRSKIKPKEAGSKAP
jgi:hypothetical protein